MKIRGNKGNTMGWAVWHEDVGTVFFEFEKNARELWDILEGKKELFKVLENGNVILIK